MKRFGYALLILTACSAWAQEHGGAVVAKPAAAPSTTLKLTGLNGKTLTLTTADVKALPHVTVTVHNTHSNKDESYSGVPAATLLAMVQPPKGEGPKVSTNMQVVIAGATDGFQVALTLCDTSSECHNGQVIVADIQDGEPVKTDGAFKLIITEDKRPARWARNLQSLTVRSVTGE